jgi:hypothetical protein
MADGSGPLTLSWAQVADDDRHDGHQIDLADRASVAESVWPRFVRAVRSPYPTVVIVVKLY